MNRTELRKNAAYPGNSWGSATLLGEAGVLLGCGWGGLGAQELGKLGGLRGATSWAGERAAQFRDITQRGMATAANEQITCRRDWLGEIGPFFKRRISNLGKSADQSLTT